jgi:hypothetical protein
MKEDSVRRKLVEDVSKLGVYPQLTSYWAWKPSHIRQPNNESALLARVTGREHVGQATVGIVRLCGGHNQDLVPLLDMLTNEFVLLIGATVYEETG